MKRADHSGRRASRTMPLAALIAVAALGLPGCFGGDDEPVVVTVPPPATTKKPNEDKKGKAEGGKQDGGSSAAAGGACPAGGSISRLRVTGGSCDQAVAVAKRWQRRQGSCNTVDDPNSPIGYKRTCTVSGFKCTARRDTSSDKRTVSCVQGAARIRFDFLG